MTTPRTKSIIAGSCFSWSSFVLLFISLVVPWYFLSWSYQDSDYDGKCTVRTVFFWAHSVCASTADCPQETCAQKSYAFWGEAEDVKGDVFALTFFLVLAATLCTLAVALFFSVRCCCVRNQDNTAKKMLASALFVLELFGLLFLTVAIIFFAAALPEAWKVEGKDISFPGPWDSFIGHTDEDDLSANSFTWVPVGWWFALLAWPFFFTTAITMGTTLRGLDAGQDGYSLLNLT